MLLRPNRLLSVLTLASLAVSARPREAAPNPKMAARGYCSMAIVPGARDSLTYTLLLGRATHDTMAVTGRVVVDVVIAPWGNTSGCGIDVWRHSALWTTPDSAGLYSVRLRAESLWASGRPTFDAFYAANYSYADGPNIVGPHSVRTDATGARRPEIAMTPVEVLALHAALSAVTHPGDSVGVARLRAWLRANPSVRTRFPGDLIMSRFGNDPPR